MQAQFINDSWGRTGSLLRVLSANDPKRTFAYQEKVLIKNLTPHPLKTYCPSRFRAFSRSVFLFSLCSIRTAPTQIKLLDLIARLGFNPYSVHRIF